MKPTTTLIAFSLSICFSQLVAAEPGPLSKRDQLKIAVQKICPVSGKPLGSMGAPPKVRIGDEDIFLCCKGCAKGQIKKEHWATIHANFATAQGKCPVMEKELPANPKWTFVKGQIVYICCPPCTKKIQADPDTYLTKVSSYYQNSLNASVSTAPATQKQTSTVALLPTNRDQLKVAVQGICPVSGNPLGSMGDPIKVQAGGMDLFLCCEGCKTGKVNAEYWSTIRNNIAKAQGICPVMEKDLPANAKSTVIDGQLVFVCCPPCTKKIEKEPAKFLGKIDSYYLATLKQQTATSPTRR
jgi:hypothetical protein